MVDDRVAIASAVEWGAGAALLPPFLGQPLCEAGTVYRVGTAPVVSMPVHAVYHDSQRDDVRIQALIEEIDQQLAHLL